MLLFITVILAIGWIFLDVVREGRPELPGTRDEEERDKKGRDSIG